MTDTTYNITNVSNTPPDLAAQRLDEVFRKASDEDLERIVKVSSVSLIGSLLAFIAVFFLGALKRPRALLTLFPLWSFMNYNGKIVTRAKVEVARRKENRSHTDPATVPSEPVELMKRYIMAAARPVTGDDDRAARVQEKQAAMAALVDYYGDDGTLAKVLPDIVRVAAAERGIKLPGLPTVDTTPPTEPKTDVPERLRDATRRMQESTGRIARTDGGPIRPQQPPTGPMGLSPNGDQS